MVSCVTRNGWDAFDDVSWTEATDVDGPNIDDFYQWAVSSDEEYFVISNVGSIADFNWSMSEEEELINSDEDPVMDFDSDNLDVNFCCDLDVGSVADLEWNTWDDACALAFQGATGVFPPDTAVVRPAVVFRDILFREGECDTAVTDGRMARISPSANRYVGQMSSEYVGRDAFIMFDCAYCTLLVWRIYLSYEMDMSTIRD